MSRAKKTPQQKMRELRPYVAFDFDLRKRLSASEKRKIAKYHAALTELKSRPHYVYRPRRDDHLRKAQEFAQHPSGLKFRAAFIPTAGDEKPEIAWKGKGKKTRIKVKTGAPGIKPIETEFLPFDPEEIAADPGAHTREVIKEAPAAKWFSIGAGAFEIRKAIKRPFIVREVERLASRYSGEAPQSAPGQNHYFGNWMTGLKVYDFKNQEDAGAYMLAKTRAARRDQQKRKATRRRANRVYYWINEKLRQVKVAKEPQPAGWAKCSRRRMNAAIRQGYEVV